MTRTKLTTTVATLALFAGSAAFAAEETKPMTDAEMAVEQTEQAIEETAADAAQATENAAEATADAASDAAQATEETLESAGAATAEAAGDAAQATEETVEGAAAATAEAAGDAAQATEETVEGAAAATAEAAEETGEAIENTAENAASETMQAAETAEENLEAAATEATDGTEEVTMGETTASADAMAIYQGMTVGDLIGINVYSQSGEDVGEIDYVIRQGDKLAGVVGVGGFLGLGEHTVAIPLEEFRFAEGDLDGLILNTWTEQELENASEFDETGVEGLDDDVVISDQM